MLNQLTLRRASNRPNHVMVSVYKSFIDFRVCDFVKNILIFSGYVYIPIIILLLATYFTMLCNSHVIEIILRLNRGQASYKL